MDVQTTSTSLLSLVLAGYELVAYGEFTALVMAFSGDGSARFLQVNRACRDLTGVEAP
jgi:hypothetical protein